MKKVLAIIGGAVLFGVLAGGTMVGINVASAKLMPEIQAETSAGDTNEDTAETIKETEASGEEEKEEIKSASSSGSGAQALDVSGIVDETMPQVVSITNTMLIKEQGYSSIFDYIYGGGQPREYTAQAAGSGVIIQKTDDELLIVTNNHVVEDATEISVTFIDGTTIDADIKGTDSDVDLAVVAVKLSDLSDDTMGQIEVATLHTEEDLKPGQGVIAIGNALGFGQSVTVGYISALDREITTEDGVESNLIQVDAAINPGNSGGALLNMDGELIGINVAKLASTQVEGVGYAIPIYKAVDVINSLSSARTKTDIPEENQGRLGIYVKSITSQYAQAFNMPEGVLVYGFDDQNGHVSGAKEAGILTNDIITEFDGQKIEDAEDLTSLVKYYEKGSVVSVTVMRLENGEYVEKTFDVTLNEYYQDDTNAQGGSGQSGNDQNGGQRQPFMPWGGQGGQGGQGGPQNGGDDQNRPQEGAPRPDAPLDNQNGQNGSENGGSGSGNDSGESEEQENETDEDIYDLFRKFMEQYQ